MIITMVLTWGVKIPLLGLWNHCRWWLQPWNWKMIASQQEIYDKPRQCTEKQRHYSADEDTFSQGYGLPSAHIVLWELGCEKGGAPKNWCLLAVVLEKTPESPSDCKEIKPAHLKGNQLWILIERTDAEAEVPACSWCEQPTHWNVPDAGKDWGQKEKRASEDEMAGWHYWCSGHELGQNSADGEGLRGLLCCSLRRP